jgi:hypothetical protein
MVRFFGSLLWPACGVAGIAFRGFLPVIATLVCDRLRLQVRCAFRPRPIFAAAPPIYACSRFSAALHPMSSAAALGDALHAALQGHHAALYEPREIASRSHFGRPGRCVNKGVGLKGA